MFIKKVIKILLILFTLSVLGTCVSGYFVFKALTEDPSITHDFQSALNRHILKSPFFAEVMEFSPLLFEESLSPIEEIKLESSAGLKEISMTSRYCQIEIRSTSEADIKLDYSFLGNSTEQKSAISSLRTDDKLELIFDNPAFNSNENDSPSVTEDFLSSERARLTVWLPTTYQGSLQLQSLHCDIAIEDNGHIQGWNVETSSGDISIILNTERVFQFDLITDNGEIVNESGAGADVRNPQAPILRAKTKKGDITVSLLRSE